MADGALGNLYSILDSLKRRVKDTVRNPSGALEQIAGQLRDDNGRPSSVGEVVNRTFNPSEEDIQRTANWWNPSPLGAIAGIMKPMKIYHGGELVRNPVADKQGVILNGVPAVSASESMLEAARYALHNRGPINEIKGNFNLYEKGTDDILDAAYANRDWGKIRDAGFDGLKLNEVPGSKEVVLFDPTRALDSVSRKADLNSDIFSRRKFDNFKSTLPSGKIKLDVEPIKEGKNSRTYSTWEGDAGGNVEVVMGKDPNSGSIGTYIDSWNNPTGKGLATELYLRALQNVKSRHPEANYVSDSIMSDDMRRLYERLRKAGIPYEKPNMSYELSSEQLQNIDFDAVRKTLNDMYK